MHNVYIGFLIATIVLWIVVTASFIATIIIEKKNPWSDSLPFLELLGILGAIFGAAALAVTLVTGGKGKIEYTKQYDIVSIERQSSVEGSFVLGFGNVETVMYYYSYQDLGDDTYKLIKFRADESLIKEINEISPDTFIEELNQNVHINGSITFNTRCYWNEMDISNYIGWDYGHCWDYEAQSEYSQEGQIKHTFDEIMGTITLVIDYIEEHIYHDK